MAKRDEFDAVELLVAAGYVVNTNEASPRYKEYGKIVGYEGRYITVAYDVGQIEYPSPLDFEPVYPDDVPPECLAILERI